MARSGGGLAEGGGAMRVMCVVLLAGLAGPAWAQNAAMPGMAMAPAPAGASPPAAAPAAHMAMSFHSNAPSTKAYEAAMDKMMTGMQAPYSGDADRDFVVGMVPHHQGAVDMAEVELQYGKDPVLRALCKRIIASQTQEIALMQGWLAKHPEKPVGGNKAIQAK